VPARMLERMAAHHSEHGRGLLESFVEGELRDGRRIVARAESAIAFVPVCARYPYETWVVPLRPAARLPDLNPNELTALARVLKETLQRLDALWNRPMPYLLSLFQAPLRGEHPGAHVHLQI